MYQKILLAVDVDGLVDSAVPVVAALSREAAGEVQVVNVRGTFADTGGDEKISEVVGRLLALGVRARGQVLEPTGRSIATVLADIARRESADLVVLGSHGRGPLVGLLKGSVGYTLAARLDRPLLMVPGSAVHESVPVPVPIRRVLVAVDSSEEADGAVLAARDLAAEHGAAVMALHVLQSVPVAGVGYGDSEESGARLLAAARRVLATAGTAAETRLEFQRRTVGATIAETARQWGADVLVVGSRRLRNVDALFVKSVTRDVLRLAAKPVLLSGPASVLEGSTSGRT